MSRYCVNKEGDHEVHNLSCHYLPASWKRIEFEAMDDFQAIVKGRQYHSDAFECFFCMLTSSRKIREEQ